MGGGEGRSERFFKFYQRKREREKEQIISKRKDIINHKEVFKK